MQRDLRIPAGRRIQLSRSVPRVNKTPGVLGSGHRATTVGIVAVMTLVAFEGMAAATAMPVVVRSLHGLALFAWTYNAWVASSLVAMVLAGQWADRTGPRLPLSAGVACFAVGAVAAASAPNMATFIIGRAVQGLGAGACIVALYVLIARAYPESLRPKVFSVLSASWVVPSFVGPVVAGWLCDHVSWRAVFALAPIFVLPPLLLMYPQLARYSGRREEPTAARAYHVPRAVAAAIGLVAFQQGLLMRGALGSAAAAAGFGLLVWAARVLLPAGTFSVRIGLPAVIAVRAIVAGAYFCAEAFIPLALTSIRHVSTTTSGLVLTCGAVSWAIGSWTQGRSKSSRVQLAGVGSVIGTSAVASLPLCLWLPHPALWAGASMLLDAFGMGMLFPSLGILTLRYSSLGDQGANSAALQVSDSIGGVVLMSIAGALQAAAVTAGGQTAATFATIWWAMAVLLIAGVLLTRRMRAPEGFVPIAG